MKLPGAIASIFSKKPEPKEVILSLLLDTDAVSGAIWTRVKKGEVSGKKTTPSLIKTVNRDVSQDLWEERLKAADSAVSELDEAVGATKINDVVLGVPAVYLTPDGDIEKSIQKEIRHITSTLDLTPIGFVGVHQAIAHTLKRDEGVPPTVILLSVTSDALTVTLYKVGVLIGQKMTKNEGEVAQKLEHILKSFKELEILPSRILLYGNNRQALEDTQAKLLRYPWQTKANFLHFPKIELLPTDFAVVAVSVAGATELSQQMGEDIEETYPSEAQDTLQKHENINAVPLKEETPLPDEEERKMGREEDGKRGRWEERDKENEENIESEDKNALDIEESNVTLVTPEELGFAHGDGLHADDYKDNAQPLPKQSSTENNGPEDKAHEMITTEKTPAVSFSHLPKFFFHLPILPRSAVFALFGFIIVGFGIFGLTAWFIPKVAVTVFVIPQQVEESAVVTIEPTATVVDPQNKIIPGKKQEKIVSGEKIIQVTGKKKVGEPAKGIVTIFNKATTNKSFKKGSIIVSNSLSFTLDDDVQVASASENLISGTVTFGKGTVGITASEIGGQSNLALGSEFTFKDIASSVAIARNEKALSGGTSRDVTVVSRSDYDTLTKSLTQDLVENAKKELATSVEGSEKLIDETIKTSVSEKSFTEELDQEASELHGKLTLVMSGISYSEHDIASLLSSVVADKVPQGYTVDTTSVTTSIENALIKKDGTITVSTSLKGSALPSLDIEEIKKNITGKKLDTSQDYLKRLPGVGGAEFRFRFSLSKDKLPANSHNVSISIAIQ
ncbi:hypothetical protein HY409_02385 [Candidatus Gottesmanbacteria bacterium]|nr:hypothetical protein [Candidatus Gottesmanbacteria bacterium]